MNATPRARRLATALVRPQPRGLAAVAVVAAVGLAISATAALLWRASARSHERDAFAATAADVTANIASELRRDTDFIATIRAVVSMQPDIGSTGLMRWYRQMRGAQRQAGAQATAVIVPVPASRLAAFQARRRADPAFMRLAGGNLQISPSGRRSRYCLLSAGISRLHRSPLVEEATHVDWCTNGLPNVAGILRAESRTGRLGASPPVLGTVFLGAAVYRAGAPLSTPAQRRAATVAWIWTSFDIAALIRHALATHGSVAATLSHANPGTAQQPLGAAGREDGPFAAARRLKIDGSWLVQVRGAATLTGLSADAQGILVGLMGAIVTALVAALGIVQVRARQHAMALVQEKTGQLRHQALHDALTGLPNRILALDRAEQMLAGARRRHAPVAALFVDLDGFKHVNDTFGHSVGDEVLKVVAQRLRQAVREGDTAARLGGDEFVVLMEDAELGATPERVADRLLEALRRPYPTGGRRPLSLGASIGIAVGLPASADELLRDADIALYEAKAGGRGRYVIFESSMQTAIQERITLEMDLAEAVSRNELFLLYQPTFELGTERVVGVEALLRWRHPTRGTLSPDEFIPIAEQSGLIVPIGRWVLEEACARASDWHRRGRHIGMAINVSARQIDREGLVDEVRTALHDTSLRPDALTLEVTETTIMRDAPTNARRLATLKDLGVRIAIDDFGTGYSSLAYLRQFPVDALKLDRSFVSGLASSKEAAALIHTLVQLAKTLELETVAEGIDDQAQLDALRREGCDLGQGFLFSPPLPPDALEALLMRADDSAQPGVRA